MATSNSGAAYQLSAYQAERTKKRDPQLKVVKSARSNASAVVTVRAVASFAVVVTLFTLIIYNQARLTEITEDINSLTKQLEELKSENVVMTSTLESIISLTAISEQAKNDLGMNRLDKHQTEYIVLQQEDKIELTEQSPSETVTQKLQLRMAAALNRLQEYIAG